MNCQRFGISIFAALIVIGCSTPTTATTEARRIDLVPVVGFENLGSSISKTIGSRLVTQPITAETATAFTSKSSAKNLYSLGAPVVSGFQVPSTTIRVGDSVPATMFGSSVSFATSESNGEILFHCILADGSGWVKVWYTPSLQKFRYSQFLYLIDSAGYINGSPSRFVIYGESDDLAISSSGSQFIGKIRGGNYYSVNGGGISAQYFGDCEVYGGPMSTSTQNGGGYIANGYSTTSSPTVSLSIATLEDFVANEQSILTYLKGNSQNSIETAQGGTRISTGVGYYFDPALSPSSYGSFTGTWSTRTNLTTSLQTYSAKWAEDTALIP